MARWWRISGFELTQLFGPEWNQVVYQNRDGLFSSEEGGIRTQAYFPWIGDGDGRSGSSLPTPDHVAGI